MTATVKNHPEWVYSKAREVDIFDPTELEKVIELSRIMSCFRHIRRWAAVSSNNISWTATTTPLRVIQVPPVQGLKYLTLINPEIECTQGQKIWGTEECGSIPHKKFDVQRYESIVLHAYVLRQGMLKSETLKYGLPNALGSWLDENVIEHYQQKSRNVQHELNHLEGILISSMGTAKPVRSEPTNSPMPSIFPDEYAISSRCSVSEY